MAGDGRKRHQCQAPYGAVNKPKKKFVLFARHKFRPTTLTTKSQRTQRLNSLLQRWPNQDHHHPMALSTLTHQLLRPPHPQQKIMESGRPMQVPFFRFHENVN